MDIINILEHFPVLRSTRSAAENATNGRLDVARIRKNFAAINAGRIVTNNAASTQIPDSLLSLYKELSLTYENVHRGQSLASRKMSAIFENSYRIIANFVGARSPREIVLYRGTTEAINSIMYSLMTEFRDGDNVVTTYMEHNSNYVPWYGLTHEILPRFGIKVECRLAEFDRETGELDIDHLASLVDKRTKIICCTGASNFLGTKPPLDVLREIAGRSGYEQPNGIKRSYLLIDGAQLIPNAGVDVVETDIDFLAWSFHKMLAPVGVGGLYAREEILETLRPFQYGGDMIAEGKVSPDFVDYNVLPWKFTAGTPNITGTVIAGQAVNVVTDMALGVSRKRTSIEAIQPLYDRRRIQHAMSLIEEYEQELGAYLIEELSGIKGITIYGPKDPRWRTCLVSFNIDGKNPFEVADYLAKMGIESRAGCHCATLAHYFYGLNPMGSCRISPYFYNSMAEMRYIIAKLKKCTTK
jgi:cysteine desulfurase / selenocysteine lyase